MSYRTITIDADQLRPGDLLHDGARPRRITEVRRAAGSMWPIAVDGTGWAIALARRPIHVWRASPLRAAP